MSRTRVIAAFPATGKSYMAATVPDIADSDSSSFSWKYTHPDVRQRHPDWPGNYICHLRELLQSDVRLVLVSTHAEVREGLVRHGIPFTLVYPRAELRGEYRARMERRGSPPGLIAKVVDELWDTALAECAQQEGCHHVVLNPGEYLTDALELEEATVPEPSAEAIEATASIIVEHANAGGPAVYAYDRRYAAKALTAAYAIDAPRFRAEGFEAGRAAMRDEIVAVLREVGSAIHHNVCPDCGEADHSHPMDSPNFCRHEYERRVPVAFVPLDDALDAIEAAFPTTGERT